MTDDGETESKREDRIWPFVRGTTFAEEHRGYVTLLTTSFYINMCNWYS